MKKPLLYLLILLVTVFSTSCSQSSKETFEIGDKTFLLNGKPFRLCKMSVPNSMSPFQRLGASYQNV